MKFETALEVYDYFIVDELKKKHSSFNANWLFAPPTVDIGFRLAQQTFGSKFFPIFFVFRDTPAVRTDDVTHVVKFAQKYPISEDDDRLVNIINVYLKYQIDFYSNDMFLMNKFNIDFFKFQSNRYVEFNFASVGVNYDNRFEVIFSDDISANHTIDEMYTTGLYFHYTYGISLLVPLFEVSASIPLEFIKISIYDKVDLLNTYTVGAKKTL